MTTTALTTYGPLQFPDRVGLEVWQFERAQRLGLIPKPDAKNSRWSAEVFDDVLSRVDSIKQATGTLPDLGAARAERHLAERLSMTINPGTAAELARRGHLPVRGAFRGHPLYCGLALEQLRDRRKIERASTAGHLLMRDAAAQALGVRDTDFGHLVRAGLLHHAATAEGWFHSEVLLYRQADLDRLIRSRRIDWPAVKATPKGSRSPLAALPTRKATRR